MPVKDGHLAAVSPRSDPTNRTVIAPTEVAAALPGHAAALGLATSRLSELEVPLFHVSWTGPDGTRDGFFGATAKDTIHEVLSRGVAEAPGLKITDAEKTKLSVEALSLLAAQQHLTGPG